MSKETSVIVIGLWVLVMPYLGIYRSWLTVLMVLTGLGLILIGFLLRGESIARPRRTGRPSPDQSFIESDASLPPHHPHEHQEGLQSFN